MFRITCSKVNDELRTICTISHLQKMGRKDWRTRLALKTAHCRDFLAKLSLCSPLVLYICGGTVHVQGCKCFKVCLLDGNHIVLTSHLHK